jgi:uncharacterized protein (UPF0335 family)
MSEPSTGHNSREQLKAIVSRIEAVELEIKGLSDDRGDIYKEASSNGFDVPALRAIVRARREDPKKRAAREAMIDLYRGQMGLE